MPIPFLYRRVGGADVSFSLDGDDGSKVTVQGYAFAIDLFLSDRCCSLIRDGVHYLMIEIGEQDCYYIHPIDGRLRYM